MDVLPVALVQAAVFRKSPSANLDALVDETDRAAKNGARVVVLPELWNQTFLQGERDEPSGKDRLILSEFSRLAKRHELAIVAGSVAMRCQKRLLNRCHVFGPKGNVILTYDKIHVFPSFFESEAFKGGSTLGICDLFGWKTGVLVCFDVEFPEVCRSLAEKGVQLLVVVGAWPAEHIRIWKTLISARSIENQLFTLGVNRCDRSPLVQFGGHSLAVNPFGETILELDDRPATEIVGLRKDLVEKARTSDAVWCSRREEIYRKWR
jgi:predicted amidohydrolase